MTTTRFVPPRVPLVNPETGLITREWYLLFLRIMDPQATGQFDDAVLGTIAPDISGLELGLMRAIDDAAQYPPPVDYSHDIHLLSQGDQGPPDTLYFRADDVLPMFQQMRDEISELRKVITGMLQGTIVL